MNLVYAVKTKAKRGPGRPRKSSFATSFVPKRGPGRPRKSVESTDSLDALVSAMKRGASASASYRRALEQVFELVSAALKG